MSLKDLKKFIKIAKDEGVNSLKYEGEEGKFQVEFAQSGAYTQIASIPTTHSAPMQEHSNEKIQEASKFHQVMSPFVGTFYAAATPDDANFVKVGDKVSKGQVLCILEAMKIMNEIEADKSGEIVEICVDNESLVEFGQPLFSIK